MLRVAEGRLWKGARAGGARREKKKMVSHPARTRAPCSPLASPPCTAHADATGAPARRHGRPTRTQHTESTRIHIHRSQHPLHDKRRSRPRVQCLRDRRVAARACHPSSHVTDTHHAHMAPCRRPAHVAAAQHQQHLTLRAHGHTRHVTSPRRPPSLISPRESYAVKPPFVFTAPASSQTCAAGRADSRRRPLCPCR